MQFSCCNDYYLNIEIILALDYSDDAFCKAVKLSYYLLKNKIDDPTNGSTHYHTTTISPKWVEDKQPTVVLGDHMF